MLLPWFLLILGIIARILVPWLIARREDPTLPWSWHYVWPQLVSFVVIVLMLPLMVSDLAQVSHLELQFAFLVGWGAADVGNTGRKLLNGVAGK
jgi:hypothetical protein